MLPEIYMIKQHFDTPPAINCTETLKAELERVELKKIITPGSRVGIATGSRGIAHIAEIIKTVVTEVKDAGGKPFIIPAMGSHGGATPEGQKNVLYELGITEDSIGAPIDASMDTEKIGSLENDMPVYVAKSAMNADIVIVVNRVKPHTDFKDEIESGLMKMMVIGLGKQWGAREFHSHGKEAYHTLLVPVAREIMKKAPIKLGIAIVENQNHDTALIKALRTDEIEQEEKRLLVKAKEWMMTLPFKKIDVLIIEEAGKEISGVGVDPNVTGRFAWPEEKPPELPDIELMVTLDLTKAGNAVGMGLADIITKRFYKKIDFNATYMNALTSGIIGLTTGKMPIVMPSDKAAIELALSLLDRKEIKLVRIKNTLELERFWVSESLLSEAKNNPKLELIQGPKRMEFDVLGNLR